MMTDDKDITLAMRENPEKGFRLLMTNYKETVYWHIRRLVVSHDDAQDVAQETFVRVFRSFSQYGEANSLRAWILRIATNEALRWLGRQKNATMFSLDDATGDMLSLKADNYYDELSYEEIATVTGSSAASAKTNYHLAKEKIVKYMQSEI